MLRKGPLWAAGAVPRADGSGIDAGTLQTDGHVVLAFGETLFRPFDADEAAAVARRDRDPRLAAEVFETALAEALAALSGYRAAGVAEGPFAAVPIAPGIVAEVLGVPVVTGLEVADSDFGGQGGAVGAAFYHALARAGARSLWVVETVGALRLTFADAAQGDPAAPGALMHHDLGPAPIQRLAALGIAATEPGQVHEAALAALGDGDEGPLSRLAPADARATLVAATALAVAARIDAVGHAALWFPEPADPLLVQAIAAATGQRPATPSQPAPTALAALGYAFAAVRTLYGLPTAFPGTTGVAAPVGGGLVSRPGGLTAAPGSEI